MSDLEEDTCEETVNPNDTTFFDEAELSTENGEDLTVNSSNTSSPVDDETTTQIMNVI